MENMKSILSFQNIYDLDSAPNVLIYKDNKIPCICKTEADYVVIDCECLFTIELQDLIKNNTYIKINNVVFYVKNGFSIKETKVGKPVILKFGLVSKEPLQIHIISAHDVLSAIY